MHCDLGYRHINFFAFQVEVIDQLAKETEPKLAKFYIQLIDIDRTI